MLDLSKQGFHTYSTRYTPHATCGPDKLQALTLVYLDLILTHLADGVVGTVECLDGADIVVFVPRLVFELFAVGRCQHANSNAESEDGP